MVLVGSFLAEGARSRTGGTPTEVRLHVTEDEFQNGGGFLENAGCIGVSAETSRRLACDAAVEVVEDAAGRVVRTGRRTRSVPTGMRRALEVRDQHRCAFPSCTHTKFLDAHHLEHWADGGATFMNEDGYRIERTAQGTQFVAPGKRPIPTRPPLPKSPSAPIERLVEAHADRGLSLGALPLMPQNWDGERADHEWILGVMCQQTFAVGRSSCSSFAARSRAASWRTAALGARTGPGPVGRSPSHPRSVRRAHVQPLAAAFDHQGR